MNESCNVIGLKQLFPNSQKNTTSGVGYSDTDQHRRPVDENWRVYENTSLSTCFSV